MDRAVIEPYLNGLALGLLIVMGIAFFYVLVYIHDIPYEIAKKRNHPHAEALHVAGWISLFLMHAIWPILWIWAYWYNLDGSSKTVLQVETADSGKDQEVKDLHKKLEELQSQFDNLQEK